MLNLVEARNVQGSLLSLTLDDASDGLIINDILGLGPVKTTIASSSIAQKDGVQYHASRREARNLILKLDLEPDYIDVSVRDLRNRLYDFFMSNTWVDLRFYDSSGLTVDISGLIESCDPEHFTQEPKMNISIMCFEPDYVETESIVLTGETVEDTTETLVDYAGTSPAGFVFVLNVDRSLSEFTIYHRAPNGTTYSMDFSGELEAGDVLTISTVPGSKHATLTRAFTDTSVLYGIPVQASYPQFSKGENYIRVYAIGEEIPYTITYTNRYGGL